MTDRNEWISSDFKKLSMKMTIHFDMEIERLIAEAETAGLFMPLMVTLLRWHADKLSDRLSSDVNE